MKPKEWTCSTTRLVIEQVLRKTWVSQGKSAFFFVFERLLFRNYSENKFSE
jgi:predicted transcriptional regulator